MRDVSGFGIMSCRFAALLHSTTTFSPLSYTTYSSLPLHPRFWLSLCHLCYCQSCESLFGRIIGTHICSRRNLVCVLSDEYLEEKLIIIVGGGDQRETRRERGECFESKLWAYDFTLLLLLLLPSTHCSLVAKSCPCRPRPVWKGLAYSMWGFFSLASAGTT